MPRRSKTFERLMTLEQVNDAADLPDGVTTCFYDYELTPILRAG